ncbi:hypothetical protein MtrunA17_Chr2g0277701 [Medicago truncatula]|uniref:Uncharacterized protein n=1 Tax=Medicago truncatula TaxID=3880 RepID=A0A396J4U7_MEDTR|nr:hypothetical protein MtrunA17_Chr2g0277701 [Medicago truncatula]
MNMDSSSSSLDSQNPGYEASNGHGVSDGHVTELRSLNCSLFFFFFFVVAGV